MTDEEKKEKQREYRRQYYEANREKEFENKRRYRKANREKVRERERQYRTANRDKMQKKNKRYRERNLADGRARARAALRQYRARWIVWLINRGYGVCSRCNTDYSNTFAVIDLHHIDPEKKGFAVSNHFGRAFNEKNQLRVLSELQKCIPLCANCHRIVHYAEQFKSEEPPCQNQIPSPSLRINLAPTAAAPTP